MCGVFKSRFVGPTCVRTAYVYTGNVDVVKWNFFVSERFHDFIDNRTFCGFSSTIPILLHFKKLPRIPLMHDT